MVNARPRADVLFRIGVILLLLSLACPVVATWIYWRYEPLSGDEIARIVSLKQSLGDLPKDFNLSTSRDWHLLLGGLTFGFLCLAAAKGILTLQANEMKRYFELSQRMRYFERLYDIVELHFFQDFGVSDKKDMILRFVAEKLLDGNHATSEEKQKRRTRVYFIEYYSRNR